MMHIDAPSHRRPGDPFSGHADFWELWTPAGCARVLQGHNDDTKRNAVNAVHADCAPGKAFLW